MFRSIFIALCFTTLLFSREKIRPEYDFRDSSFSLTYRFDIPNIPDDEILNMLFNFDKVKEYSSKTNVKVTLIEENQSTNRILYEYNYHVAKLGVVMFREKIPQIRTVIFKMEKYNRSAKIIPDVISASGSYEIASEGEILYKQSTAFNSGMLIIHKFFIKRDVQGYLREVMEYIDAQAKTKNL